MSSLKQVIYNALVKCATPEHGVTSVEYETPEAARDAFIAMVMAELFPTEEAPQEAVVPIVVEAVKAKKSPKKSPEEKAAAKAEKEAAKKAKAATPKKSPKKSPEEKAAEKEAAKAAKAAAKAAKEAEKEAAKAAKAAEKEAAKAAAKAAKAAEKEAAKAAKKAAKSPAKVADVPVLPASPKAEPKAEPKPKKAKAEKPAEDANVQKIDPTWRKHLKAAAKAAGKEASKELETELLAYLNGLTKEAFNATKAEEHVKVFLAPAAAAPQEEAPVNLEAIEVNFNGKTYFVDPVSKRVYEQDGEVFRGVGYAGMSAFEGLEVPEDDE